MGKSWKNPHKEAAAQKKGKIFTKMAREITVAAKLGGGDPEGNARLKMAIAAARAVSCPKDTIEKAIKRGTGEGGDDSVIEELMYEGLGPAGVGIIVECQTDNRNRTISELRTIFKKNGGNLGETGSVAWNFDRIALVAGAKSEVGDPEEEAIEAGADDVEKTDDGDYVFFGTATDLDVIRSGLTERGWDVQLAELSYKPKNTVAVAGDDQAALDKLLEALDDCDDTHRVYSNAE